MRPIQRVAMYVRVSTQEQADGHSLDTQRELLGLWAAREDWACAGVYSDAGITGTSVEKRAAFQRMVLDAERGAFDAVLVKNRSRYARDMADALLTERRLLACGVRVMSLDEPAANEDTPGGFLFRGFSDLIAHHYSIELSHKTRLGWKKRAEKGLPGGDIPFGYRSGGLREAPLLVPNEAEAVRGAFERYARGTASLVDIATWLTAQGFAPRSKRGTPNFGSKTVLGMLTNRFYMGDITYHGEVVAKGLHEPIVDAALFDRAQRARDARTNRPVRRGEPVTRAYLLRGIATCVTCGGPMWANTMSHGGGHRYYRCAARIRGHSCDAAKTSLRAELVEEYVAGMFASWEQPSDWRALIAQDDRSGIDEERRRTAARMSRVRRALLDGLVPYEQASEELRALEGQLAALDGRAAGDIGRGDELTDVRELWPLMTPEERHTFVRLVLKSVVLDMDEGAVVGMSPQEDFEPLFRVASGGGTGALTVVTWRPRSDSNRRSPP